LGFPSKVFDKYQKMKDNSDGFHGFVSDSLLADKFNSGRMIAEKLQGEQW